VTILAHSILVCQQGFTFNAKYGTLSVLQSMKRASAYMGLASPATAASTLYKKKPYPVDKT
jgi:hypothetical protein